MNKSTWAHPLSHIGSVVFGFCMGMAYLNALNDGSLERILLTALFSSIGLAGWHRFIASLITDEKAKNHE